VSLVEIGRFSNEAQVTSLHPEKVGKSGFAQKSDRGFPDFSTTKLLLLSRLFNAFCSSLCEQKHYKIGF